MENKLTSISPQHRPLTAGWSPHLTVLYVSHKIFLNQLCLPLSKKTGVKFDQFTSHLMIQPQLLSGMARNCVQLDSENQQLLGRHYPHNTLMTQEDISA